MKRVVIILGFLLLASPAFTAPAFVQACKGSWISGTTYSASCTYSAHHLVYADVVVVSTSPGNSENPTISDGTNTYTPIDSLAYSTGALEVNALNFYVKDSSAGSFTITVTLDDSSILTASVGLKEYSGTDLSAPLDVHSNFKQVTNIGTGADAITTDSVTTTANGELLIGSIFSSRGGVVNYTAGTGYTTRDTYTSSAGIGEDQIETTAGTVHFATATQDYSDALTDTFAAIATFKAAGSGLATPTFVQACKGHWTSGTTMVSDSCNLTAGNLVVVGYFIDSGGGGSVFQSFDGDGTSSYSLIHAYPGAAFFGRYIDVGTYYAIVSSSGSVNVTVTMVSSGLDQGSIGILEYSGIDAMSPVDTDAIFNHQSDAGTGGGFLTSSSINTTADSDLIVSFMWSSRGGAGINYTSAAGYTKRDTYETTTGMSEDKNQTSHGAITATATQDYSDGFTDTFTDITAFKAAASGGGGGGGGGSTARSLSSLGVGR